MNGSLKGKAKGNGFTALPSKDLELAAPDVGAEFSTCALLDKIKPSNASVSWGALLYQKGRELLPEGIVYYSEETHYSVSKVLRVLALRNIMIKTLANGEIDYEDLRETVRIHRDVPPIILASIGTTMKGAVDNVDTIQGVLRDFALPNFYIHCDAALSGMILPFAKDPEPYDFAAGIDSISRRVPPWRRAAPPAPRATWPQKHHHDDALREVSPRLHRRGRLFRPGRQNVRTCCSG